MADRIKDRFRLFLLGGLLILLVFGCQANPGAEPVPEFKVLIHPEKYSPAMSSTPGLRLQADYEGPANKVRYTAEKGCLFTWNIPSGKISERETTLEVSLDQPVYWGPSYLEEKQDFAQEGGGVTVTLLAENGDKIAEQKLTVVFEDNAYFVEPADNIEIGIKSQSAEGPQTLDEAVSLAVKGRRTAYGRGEAATEGHIILDSEEKDGLVKVYTISSFGAFGFENGIFTKVSGSGAIPTVITFAQQENGVYTLAEYQEPMDGAMLGESIRKMFPARLHDQVLTVSAERRQSLVQQQVTQAEAYLQSIGREAEVSYAHVDKTLIKMNVDASNKLFSELTKYDQFLNDCPYWQGTREKVEDGVRYIYETSYSKTADGYDLVTFQKKTEDGTVVQEAKYKIVSSDVQLVE
ncbi:MAG: hypothetical protein RBT41_02545 [Clostridia bacterium]|jgi:bla regulator protein BlaR1|nr:hypothetical protein [Clostridia bacterium]